MVSSRWGVGVTGVAPNCRGESTITFPISADGVETSTEVGHYYYNPGLPIISGSELPLISSAAGILF